MQEIESVFWGLNQKNRSEKVAIHPFDLAFSNSESIESLISEKTVLSDVFIQLLGKVLASRAADHVGFSVHTFSQLYFALQGTCYIKEQDASTHVTIGGNFLCRYRDKIDQFPAVLPEVDTVVLFAGENALFHILSHLHSKGDTSSFPNIIELKDQKAIYTRIQPKADLNDFIEPDYTGLDLNNYLSPQPIISLPVTKGCRWRRCSFCSYNLVPYKAYSPEVVVSVIESIVSKYQVKHFNLSVSELEPDFLKPFCKELMKRKLNIHWTSMIRLDKQITEPLIQDMVASGCRLLAAGIESASPEVLGKMNKGIDLEVADQVVKNLSLQGIGVIGYFITHFPGETIEDLRLTLEYIEKRRSYFFGLVLSEFRLTTCSPIFMNPGKYGITMMGQQLGDLYTVMQQDGNFEWQPAEKNLLDVKHQVLKEFKQRCVNFYDHPDQMLPLRGPKDIFYNFLYLSKGILTSDPDSVMDEKKFKTSILERPETWESNSFLSDIEVLMMELSDGVRTVDMISGLASSQLNNELKPHEIVSILGFMYHKRQIEIRGHPDEKKD